MRVFSVWKFITSAVCRIAEISSSVPWTLNWMNGRWWKIDLSWWRPECTSGVQLVVCLTCHLRLWSTFDHGHMTTWYAISCYGNHRPWCHLWATDCITERDGVLTGYWRRLLTGQQQVIVDRSVKGDYWKASVDRSIKGDLILPYKMIVCQQVNKCTRWLLIGQYVYKVIVNRSIHVQGDCQQVSTCTRWLIVNRSVQAPGLGDGGEGVDSGLHRHAPLAAIGRLRLQHL